MRRTTCDDGVIAEKTIAPQIATEPPSATQTDGTGWSWTAFASWSVLTFVGKALPAGN